MKRIPRKAAPPALQKAVYLPRGEFPLAVTRIHGTAAALHAHEFHELVVITSGSGVHVTEQESWPMAAGDVFVIKGDQAHGYLNSEGIGLVNILFDPDRLALPRRDLQGLPGYHALFALEPEWRQRHHFKSRLCLSVSELAHTGELLDALIRELQARTPGYQLMARTLFLQLVTFLSRCFSHTRTTAPRQLLRIAEAISHLETHLEHELYLEDLAAIAHMSKRNFLRAFRDAMGSSPMAYLVSRRIARAAELLRQEDLTITEAASRVGFEDSNYFARQFRRILGASPSEFIRRAGRQAHG